MPDSNDVVFAAAAFAAHAHRHQIRKDNKTPYVSHVFRVCLVVRHVFEIDDPKVLAAALLHDTIEDTHADYDDLRREFGDEIADWVSALTKNKAMPEEEREKDYGRRLAAAGWQVKVCKVADVYDNMNDCRALDDRGRRRIAANSRRYLEDLRPGLPEQAREAFQLTENKLKELEAGTTA